jgi:hypothetical protein
VFSRSSFSPISFGPSWGLTWEAAQELLVTSGGPDSKSRTGYHEQDETDEERHLRLHKERNTKLYAKDEVVQIPPPAQGNPVLAPLSESPVPFYSDPLSSVLDKPKSIVTMVKMETSVQSIPSQEQEDEEAIVLLLLAA